MTSLRYKIRPYGHGKAGEAILNDTDAPCFVFRGNDVLLSSAPEMPLTGDVVRELFPDVLREGTFTRGDVLCRWIEISPQVPPPDGTEFSGMRGTWSAFGDEWFSRAGHAYQLMEWERTTRHCSRCGAAMRNHATDRAKECPSCGFVSYPVICPVVIVAVVRDGKLLLARNAGFPTGRHSVIAGFVEAGESLEAAVAREIREEVAIEVGDLRYFGSQPWPFPHSLMIGFRATWKSGDIRPDGREIVEAGWYGPESHPDIPPYGSISRRLIDAAFAEIRATEEN